MFAQYAGVDWPTGEPIILDSSMLGNLSPEDAGVLRLVAASSPTWPIPADTDQRPVGPVSRVASKVKASRVGRKVKAALFQ